MNIKKIALALLLLVALVSCRRDTPVEVIDPLNTSAGFYLLNQGNMGSNKASLDYYDYATSDYKLDIFQKINPDVTFKLGDVGNDLQIYGNRMYAVINLSNMVEVMDSKTGKHIGNFTVPNCRYIAFHGGKAYVTSYAGTVGVKGQIGFVAEIDTLTLKETRRVEVGYQPEGLTVVGNKLYVANSGGYEAPNYDRTVSVIDLSTMKEIKKIDVAINLNTIQQDSKGNIYVLSRGDYDKVVPAMYKIDTKTDTPTPLAIGQLNNFIIVDDVIYAYTYDYSTMAKEFLKCDLRKEKPTTEKFLSDEASGLITAPYCIAYNKNREEFYITDAKSYTIPGEVFCFAKDGTLVWKNTTGDIPCAIAFVGK